MRDFSPQAQRDFLFWAEQALTIDTATRATRQSFESALRPAFKHGCSSLELLPI